MAVNYNKLWKLMIDKNISKSQLRMNSRVSTNVIAKLGRNEPVSIQTLSKICTTLHCDIGDIMEINLDNEVEANG